MNIESRIIDVMSGRARGWRAAALRGVLAAVEPVYAKVATLRNRLFDSGQRKAVNVARPVISVGNITTGGTGKTPIVAWIANHLWDRGHRPAILLRGYKSSNGLSDEATLLEKLAAPSLVMANANRIAGASELLKRDPSISCFVLDDGFQHRQIDRQLDVVLIDATAPFGFEHVLPRGLLREPLEGLRRADVVVITRCDRATPIEIDELAGRIREYLPDGPVLQCSLKIDHFLDEQNRMHPLAEASGGFAICGIGNPRNFIDGLSEAAGALRGEAIFSDHHSYIVDDLTKAIDAAVAVNGRRLLTTEKDWVKLKALNAHSSLPIWRAVQTVRWADGDEEKLAAILSVVVK